MKCNLGKVLGRGCFRTVYQDKDNKDVVIKKLVSKKQKGGKTYNENKIEWNFWNIVKETKFAKYFCPCVEISKDYKYLKMVKASKIKERPKVGLPSELCNDIKNIGNWGKLNGSPVIIDYGHQGYSKICKSEMNKLNEHCNSN